MNRTPGAAMELFKDAWLVVLGTPVLAGLVVLEVVLSRGAADYSRRGTLTNCTLAAVNVLLDVALRGFWLGVLTATFQYRRFELPSNTLYWVSLVVLQDFLFYWLHRTDHAVRLLWAVHATHHSSEEFNLTVGIRPSALQPLYRFAWFLPLAVLGFRPEDVLLMYSVTQVFGILVHTRHVQSLGPLDWVLVTPSHHRVHHGCNRRYLDKNFGMVLIVWDRLFGTFQSEDEPVRYGLNGGTNATANPLRALTQEWRDLSRDCRRAVGWRARIDVLLDAPKVAETPR
jgi:sterol desaturase/sphingolipid hydroxylase (fatty acid hydroxylase superfamily)